MTERWVKATPAATKTSGIRSIPIWVNMATAVAVSAVNAGGGLDTTAQASVTFSRGTETGDQWFEEPPEHFLPKGQLAEARLYDALAEIREMRKYGDHGAIDIADQAIERWKASRK